MSTNKAIPNDNLNNLDNYDSSNKWINNLSLEHKLDIDNSKNKFDTSKNLTTFKTSNQLTDLKDMFQNNDSSDNIAVADSGEISTDAYYSYWASSSGKGGEGIDSWDNLDLINSKIDDINNQILLIESKPDFWEDDKDFDDLDALNKKLKILKKEQRDELIKKEDDITKEVIKKEDDITKEVIKKEDDITKEVIRKKNEQMRKIDENFQKKFDANQKIINKKTQDLIDRFK